MCKIGVLSIGLDLYHSAFQHFQTLLLQGPSNRVIMDLAAHFFALMTLVQTFRGRVNRQAAGRIVFPVLAVKGALELDKLIQKQTGGGFSIGTSTSAILVILKSAVFVIITAKLAFGTDKSYVGYDEWFPRDNNLPPTISEVDDNETSGEKEEGANNNTTNRRREKKTK